MLGLTLEQRVTPGRVLSVTPAPEETGRLFAFEGEVLTCAGPRARPAERWFVELALSSVTPGDLETLRLVLAR